MEAKHFSFLATGFVLFLIGVAVVRRNPRARDWVFGLGVYLTTDLGKYDINLWGRESYRGTARGVEISFLDVAALVLFVTTPRVIRGQKVPTYRLYATYAAYCLFSIVTNEPMLFGSYELPKILRALFILVTAARYVTGPKQVRVAVISVAVCMFYEAYVGLSDRYLHGIHRIGGTLDHPNNLSVFANIAAPVLLCSALGDYAPRYRALFALGYAVTGGCILLTISRTGAAVFVLISALVVVSLVRIKLSRRQIMVGMGAILLALGAVYRAKDSLMERYASASLAQEVESDGGRGMYFRLGAAVFDERPFGVGLNNWSWVVTNEYYAKLDMPFRPYESLDCDFTDYTKEERNHMVAPPAHNLWILTMGEVGIIGFTLFVAIWFRWMRTAFRFVSKDATDVESRYATGVFFAFVGLTLTMMTEYVYRLSQIFFFAHLLVGVMMGVVMTRKRRAARARALALAERRKLRDSAAKVRPPAAAQPVG